MICCKCNFPITSVKETLYNYRNNTVVRRRKCKNCNVSFSTTEEYKEKKELDNLFGNK